MPRIAGREYYASGKIKPLARNHRAEEARRLELARQRGFTNRSQQRKAIETGKVRALQPYRVRSGKTVKAQNKYLAYEQLVKGYSMEQRAQDWSDLNARTEMGAYLPDRAKGLGVTKAVYRRAYLDAFVMGDDRYYVVRHQGGSPALHYWLVDLNGFEPEDEYQRRYGMVG